MSKNVKNFAEYHNLNEVKSSIKPYDKVKVGDDAFENPDAGGHWDKKIGKIIWKGTYQELLKSKYKNTVSDWEFDDESEFDDFDLVVVDLYGSQGGPTLFNYDNDPSGAVTFESVKVNETRKFKDFIDVVRAAEVAYGDGDMEIKSTSNGFTYLDVDDEKIEVIVKGNKASIVGGEQNMSMDDFIDLVSGGDPESLYEQIDEISEGKKAKVSKALLQATDNYHAAQLKLQQLQKEFIETSKEDVVKREKLKKEIMSAHKEVQQTEKEFQATLGAEDVDDIEIIW
jgi:vacuolar-type H+-ATPase subunit H